MKNWYRKPQTVAMTKREFMVAYALAAASASDGEGIAREAIRAWLYIEAATKS